MGMNPVVPNVGMADPHVHLVEFGNEKRFLMFATHDYSPNNTGFKMLDWWIWGSTDLVHWVKEDEVSPERFSWDKDSDECWATDGAVVNGSVYFFVSAGSTQIGLLKSSQGARGPYVDAIGAPLVPQGMVPTESRDPCVFQDIDGEFYLVWGTFNYFIARLAPDLASFAEKPHPIQILNPTGPYGNKTDDKPFMHVRNGVYYLSWGCFYGVGTSPYGPFEYVGVVVDEGLIAEDFRIGSNTSDPWYARQDFRDRHGSFWRVGEQWFWSTNDQSHSSDKSNPNYYRDTILAYVHFFNNGSMAPVVINGTGVSSYVLEDTDGRIEAENFFNSSNVRVLESAKDEIEEGEGRMVWRGSLFHVSPRSTSSTFRLEYPEVHFPSSTKKIGLIAKRIGSSGEGRVVVVGENASALCTEFSSTLEYIGCEMKGTWKGKMRVVVEGIGGVEIDRLQIE